MDSLSPASGGEGWEEGGEMAAATLHRLILAGEFGLYLLLGALLTGRCGWTADQAAALALLLAAIGRIGVIGVTFAFARAYAVPAPAPYRIGAGRALAMVLRELAAFFLLFSVVMPFERFFMGADRPGRSQGGRLPLLLIHGYQCNRGFWLWHRRSLERAGWREATISPALGAFVGQALHHRVRLPDPMVTRVYDALATPAAQRVDPRPRADHGTERVA